MAASLALAPQFDFQSDNPFDARLILDGLPDGAEAYAESLAAFVSTAYVSVVGPAASALVTVLLQAWRLATLGSLNSPRELPLGLKTTGLAKSLGCSSRSLTRMYQALCSAGLAKAVESPYALAAVQLEGSPKASPWREGKRFVLCADKLASDFQDHQRQLVESVAKANRLPSFEAANIMAVKGSAVSVAVPVAAESLIVPEPPAPRTSSSSRSWSCSRSSVLKQGLEKYPSLGSQNKGDSNAPAGKAPSRVSGLSQTQLDMIGLTLEGFGISQTARKGYKLSPVEFVALEMQRRQWNLTHLEEYIQQLLDQGDFTDLKAILLYRLSSEKDRFNWPAQRQALAVAREARSKQKSALEAQLHANLEAEELQRLDLATQVIERVDQLSLNDKRRFVDLARAQHRGIYQLHAPKAGEHPCPTEAPEAFRWWLSALGVPGLMGGLRSTLALLDQLAPPAVTVAVTDPEELALQAALAELKARLPRPKE